MIAVTFVLSILSGIKTAVSVPVYLSMPIVPSSRTEYSKSVFGFGVVLEIATDVSQPNSDAVSIVSSKSIGMIFFMMCHLS